MANFELKKPDDRVEYDIWMSSSNDRILDFISDFAATDLKLGDKVLMTPRYVYWKCMKCDNKLLAKDCFASGKYCAMESNDDTFKLGGRMIMMENLRQKCIYYKYYNQTETRHMWWEYMKYVH
jgi:hypothetical protein